ncbi:ATP synthase F1 subunit delta [Atopobium sp. oral taxon 199]|uniref:ATP synthase F1 subunit delta n=1 Tax=Atopobium sp. oral taxon 199 TaxID=712156 RepID=UPI00034E9DCF|nr:ATP synthase F1 subunit delta [Atopobium sp. oral taxon 199]EPD78865.1 ATP synthase F1, delta subunit [Atopobium sp. oral taxon 199 str. F0494]
MSANKREQEKKVEGYTRALIEAARAEGRLNADLIQWQHVRKFSPEVLETLGAMQASEDFSLIKDVADQFEELLDTEDATITVVVTTSVPLDDTLRSKIKQTLGMQFNAAIYLVERVDPSILGGIIVETRGRRYDASVRAQLTNIKNKLSLNNVESEM